MIKKILLFCALNGVVVLSSAIELQPKVIDNKPDSIMTAYMISTKISPDKLPAPYHYLLTQPLMTKGIETYYQRTPIIQTINASKNQYNNTYHRLN